LVPHIANDADDLARWLFEFGSNSLADGDALSHRIAVLPELFGQTLVDQNYRSGSAVVAVREHPPAKQRNPEHLEIT